jgi:hypothetical protein
MTAFWDTVLCSLEVDRRFTDVINRLMMEAVRTSETLVYFNDTTQSYIPEGSHLLIHSCENLKFQFPDSLMTYYDFFSTSFNPTLQLVCLNTVKSTDV